MSRYVLSLDVSASCTGWCVSNDGKNFITGTIKTTPKYQRAARLCIFNLELIKVLKKYQPEYIVIEDTFTGKNVKTAKILNEFAGVAKFTCKKTLGIEPYIVENTTVKSYFKAKTKEILFYFACELFNEKDLTFSKDNDIIDAKVQLLYYLDEILNLYKFRFKKEYGFIYKSIGDLNESKSKNS